MPITPSRPHVINQQSYNKLWLYEFIIKGYHPSQPIQAHVDLKPWNGYSHITMDSGCKFIIENLQAEAENDPDLKDALTRLEGAIERIAQKRGLI